MKVLAYTANLGGFDELVAPVPQEGLEVDYVAFTDADLPSRSRAMTPRLRARIPKMFGWDLRPGYDAYLWHDASLQLSKPDSVRWFLDQLGVATIAVFKHPWRSSAAEEADFLRMKLAKGSRYIHARYAGEDLDGQMRAITQPWYWDDKLYASGAFCYRPGSRIENAMKEWWYHTSRFHVIDQLAFPFALRFGGCEVRVIDEDIYHASHLAWTRRTHHG